MPANVETMFSVRETPWHGLGRIIMDAPASREALELAGLDWQVESRNIYSGTGAMIPGYRANVRSTDDAVLGVVSDRYRIVPVSYTHLPGKTQAPASLQTMMPPVTYEFA